MVAQHFAVVRGEQHRGVLCEALLLETGQNPADILVKLGDAAVVVRPNPLHLPGAHLVKPVHLIPVLKRNRPVKGVLVGLSKGGRRDLLWVVHGVVGLARVKGRVRLYKRREQEKRPVPVLPDKFHGFRGRPRGGVQLLWQHAFLGHIVELAALSVGFFHAAIALLPQKLQIVVVPDMVRNLL